MMLWHWRLLSERQRSALMAKYGAAQPGLSLSPIGTRPVLYRNMSCARSAGAYERVNRRSREAHDVRQ
jgi:hypothetical protein